MQISKLKYFSEKHDAHFIRPSNGHNSPGILCPEFHGSQWGNIPVILSMGLACRSDDASKQRGRQFVRGCPYLPGANRIQSACALIP
eukprot:2817527-Pyramimonas_sp.AAC.1